MLRRFLGLDRAAPDPRLPSGDSVAPVADSAAADGEVRILQRLILIVGDVLSQPVSPAAVATVPIRIF